MARTIRVLPPSEIAFRTMTVNGRPYTAAPGGFLDVPDHDAEVLLSNNWIAATPMAAGGQPHGGIGATAARPSSALRGQHYFDTTVGMDIVFDGAVWRNVLTAAAV